MSHTPPVCWVLTEGIAGTENPCIGLAEALGLAPVVKRVKLRAPWKQLSPWLAWGGTRALAPESDKIDPPYPDILISSGRKAIMPALHIKKQNRKTFHIHIQDPRFCPQKFDVIVAPQHDDIRGSNTILSTAGLHKVTPDKLAAGRAQWAEKLAHLPAPRVAVMIGGNSRAHRMSAENTQKLVSQLKNLTERHNAGLMITASRRTGTENLQKLQDAFAGMNDKVFLWDGTGDNPYFGFLGLADYIIVTADSVSMASEAIATGKPVYIAALDGGGRRIDRFHDLLHEQGYTRPFTGTLEEWFYTPPDDLNKIAAQIKKRIEQKEQD